jgi:hypothetical protein
MTTSAERRALVTTPDDREAKLPHLVVGAVSKAACPVIGCKIVEVRTGLHGPNDQVPRFANHRTPGGGTCKMSSERVARKYYVHPCRRCWALPVADTLDGVSAEGKYGPEAVRPALPRPIAGKVGRDDLCATHLREALAAIPVVHPCHGCRVLPEIPVGVELPAGADPLDHGYRPAEPRKIKGKRRCDRHLREHNERLRRGRSQARRLKTHGVSEELAATARAAQGGGCACGRPFSPKYTPRTDHDHRVARERCGHDPAHACPNCYRGDLHDACNVAIARFTSDQLRRLADYKDAGGTMVVVRARPGYTGP